MSLLVLVDRSRVHLPVLRFCNALKKGGLMIIGNVMQGNIPSCLEKRQDLIKAWEDDVATLSLKGFVEVVPAETVRGGAQQLMMLSGIGGMKPNTVILGFPESRFGALDPSNRKDTSLLSNERNSSGSAPANSAEGSESSDNSNGRMESDFLGIVKDCRLFNMNVLIHRNVSMENVVVINC